MNITILLVQKFIYFFCFFREDYLVEKRSFFWTKYDNKTKLKA